MGEWRADGEKASETGVARRSSAHHGAQPRKAAIFSLGVIHPRHFRGRSFRNISIRLSSSSPISAKDDAEYTEGGFGFSSTVTLRHTWDYAEGMSEQTTVGKKDNYMFTRWTVRPSEIDGFTYVSLVTVVEIPSWFPQWLLKISSFVVAESS